MISILIPTYNNAETLKECLKSIQNQTKKPDEIIIIDGHSKDETIKIAEEFGCKILFENGGSRAAACNVGIPQAQGEIIIFTDSDCIAKEDWIETLVEAFSEEHEGIVVATTGPNIEYPNESTFGKAVSAVYQSFIGGSWSEQSQSIFNKKKRYVSSAAGCNVAYRKEYLEEVMPFNESLITAEDTDINFRLTQKGYLLFFTPDAAVFHQRPQNFKALRNKSKKYAKGKVQFFRAHRTGLEFWHLIPPLYYITLILLGIGSFLFGISSFAQLILLYIFSGYLGLYIVILLFYSVILAIKNKKAKFLYLLPIMYIIGHIWWSIGILQEIFKLNEK